MMVESLGLQEIVLTPETVDSLWIFARFLEIPMLMAELRDLVEGEMTVRNIVRIAADPRRDRERTEEISGFIADHLGEIGSGIEDILFEITKRAIEIAAEKEGSQNDVAKAIIAIDADRGWRTELVTLVDPLGMDLSMLADLLENSGINLTEICDFMVAEVSGGATCLVSDSTMTSTDGSVGPV